MFRPVLQILLAHKTLLFVLVILGSVKPERVRGVPVVPELAVLRSSGVPDPKLVPRFNERAESVAKIRNIFNMNCTFLLTVFKIAYETFVTEINSYIILKNQLTFEIADSCFVCKIAECISVYSK